MARTPHEQEDDDTRDSFSLAIDNPPYPSFMAALPRGYGEFEIDVEAVLRDGLPTFFQGIAPAPLTAENVLRLPTKAKGGYILTLNGRDVYAGKTDTRHGFRDRLGRHFYTVQHRQNLNADAIGFKAVRIPVFSSFDAEAILIQETRRVTPGALPWNDSGFGSNDPGHNRENQEPANFDVQHPIDIDRALETPLHPAPLPPIVPGRVINTRDVLFCLKSALPYLLRYQTDLKPNGRPARASNGHADQRASAAAIPAGVLTTRTILQAVLNSLPPDWLATIFPDRVIVYKEPTPYRYAIGTMRRQ